MIIFTLAKVKHTETEEDMIVYLCLKDNQLYVRPYDMFISEVDHDKYPNVKQKYRFEPVEDIYGDTLMDLIPPYLRNIINIMHCINKEV